MKNAIIFLFLIISFLGCTSLEGIRATNRENLMKLSIGITKNKTLQIMGTETQNVFSDVITNPYRSEILKGKDGGIYEVLFYYTDIKKQDGAITDDELTPLVFKENKLIGWGWSFLNENVTKYQYQIDIR
jgi:hypothetical protein